MSKITLDNFSDNLIAYLNRQISAGGSELIGDINGLTTNNKQTLVGAINELVQICNNLAAGDGEEEEEVKATSDSFAIVDINTEGIVSDGALLDDVYASHGKCYFGSSGPDTMTLYSADFNEVKFGNYALCLRMKLNNGVTPEDVVMVSILNGTDVIMTKSFATSDFFDDNDSTDGYRYLYSTFEYSGNGGVKSNLKLKVEIPSTEVSVEVKFDYAYISMIIPSVFL